MLLHRYILRAHIGPFLFSLATLMFIFLLQFVMKFIDQLVGKGLSAWVIIELVALSLSYMFVLAVPMSVLVATLMAFGDLSSRNEITAMKASGVSIYRMLAPVFVASVIVASLLFFFYNDVLPQSNHRLKALTVDIRRKKPTLSLVDGVFSQDIQGYSILVRKTYEKSNNLEGVTLYDYTSPSMNVTITAESGAISFSPDFRKLIMDLRDGEIHQLDLQKTQAYRKVRFEKHRIAMDVEGFDFERSSENSFSRGDREMSSGEMRAQVDSLMQLRAIAAREMDSTMLLEVGRPLSGRPDETPLPMTIPFSLDPNINALHKVRLLQSSVTNQLFKIENLDRQSDRYLVEIHKKFAIPAACIIFILVGAPLGIMARRGGFGIAATLSLGFFVLYWTCLIGGEKLADRNLLSPGVGMWAANVIIGLIGLYLTVRIGRETVVIDWNFLRRLLPRRLRERNSPEEPA